ncbi:MAG: RNA polymerase sigma factor [Planctomycetota bacterium]|jgi:RNA polymerase sigma-70 factor (ECF subfamily)
MESRDDLKEIITACQAGSNEAFSRLVDLYASRCYGYFYRLTGNNAKSNDLLSMLFLRLVEKIGTFRESSGSFEKWLFTIASNIFRDQLRRQYRQQKLLDRKAEELELKASATPAKADVEMIDELQVQMARLDAETAELVMLRFYGGLTFRQIAEIRSEPLGTVLSKVHRGLKRLRELMGAQP